MGWMDNSTLLSPYLRERNLVPILHKAGWALGQVWTIAENLASAGIRSQYRPARSESLYRLRYLQPTVTVPNCNGKTEVRPITDHGSGERGSRGIALLFL
jgi:hypothetical protein